MSELRSGTETTDPATARDATDNLQHSTASLVAGRDGDRQARAAEDRVPPRQDSRDAWDDDPGYDESDLAAEYDGDLEAFMAEDDLPPRQASGAATWDDPWYDEADLGAEYDGDLDALTADGASTGDQPGEASQAGQADALTGQAAQPDDSHANPDTTPEAGQQALAAKYEASLKDLEAKYEARMKGLEDEVQVLKDRPQAAPDAPGNVEAGTDQPHAVDRKRTTAQRDATEVKDQDDRPGLWSNAKTTFYGAVGTVGTAAVVGEYFPGVSPVVAGITAGAVTIAASLVPVLRERRRREHDDTPDKP